MAERWEIEARGFASRLDDYAQGKLRPEESITLSTTPDVLVKLGVPQLAIRLTQRVIKKALGGKHNLTLDNLKLLPEQLHQPVFVFASKTQPNSLVAVTDLTDKNGKTIIAVVHLNIQQRRHVVHDIASVYGKNKETTILGWIRDGLLRYSDEKKSHLWFQSRGLQLPKEGTTPGS